MSSLCASTLASCFSVREDKSQDQVSQHGVEREMKVLYQQPHLVEPMKLRVYEDLPSTPLTALSSSLPQWQLFPSRNATSRPSSRTSRFSLKKKLSRPSISKPIPLADSADDLPFRRRQQYRPLELSIYVEEDEMPNLPEFDRLSFTEIGELKLPPKALVRTLSEQTPQEDTPSLTSSEKHISMLEADHKSPTRPDTVYSIVSTSRPPSEYEALHSHPVSWSGLLGFANATRKVDSMVDVLSPMQEEYSPDILASMADDTAPTFTEKQPDVVVNVTEVGTTPAETITSVGSADRAPSHEVSSTTKPQGDTTPPYFHTNYLTQKRISQWLSYRTHSNSTSTVESSSTTTSFAEHRQQRSVFYQLGKQLPIAPTPPPEPLRLTHTNFPQPHHERTVTVSTAATSSSVGTEVLSFGFDGRDSEDSMTTMSAAEIMSRQGTIKSVASPGGHRVTMAQVQDLGFNLPLHCRADVVEEEGPYLNEIGGPLRSPGVGIAF